MPGYPEVSRGLAATSIWRELAAARRGYVGLDAGLDYHATMAWPNKIAHPIQRNRMREVLQDGVWTPFRAARVGAGTAHCLHWGEPQADVAHLWWECSALHRNTYAANPTGWSFGATP